MQQRMFVLKYRYLDFRRPVIFEHLKNASSSNESRLEIFLMSEGFLDIETPILTKSTPEGARDYLSTKPGASR